MFRPEAVALDASDLFDLRFGVRGEVLPVMPLPWFWLLGSASVDRLVSTISQVAPPSLEATT